MTVKAGLAAGWVKFVSKPFFRGADPLGLGTGQLSWAGTLAKGNTITITAGITGFGTKTQAAPKLWVMGSDIYENGVQYTGEQSLIEGNAPPSGTINDAWQDNDGVVISKTALRTVDLDQQYYADGNSGLTGSLYWPRAFLDTALDRDSSPYGEQCYLSFKLKTSVALWDFRRVGYTNLSGTFDDGATEYDVGELAEIYDGATPTGKHVQVIYVDTVNGWVDVINYDGSYSSSSFTGMSLVGGTSAASLDFDTAAKYSTPYSSKPDRIWEADSNAIGGYRHVIDFQGRSLNDMYAPGVGAYDTRVTATGMTELQGGGSWLHIEDWVDLSGASGEGYTRINNNEYTWSGGDLTYKAPSNGPVPSLIGIDIAGGTTGRYQGWFGEIYADTVPHRIVIGDAATYAACTTFDYLRPTAWSDSEISAVYFQGTGYLYIVDSTGEPVETDGVAIA